MSQQTDGNPTRLELTQMIASIREAYGLSIREYAKVVGIPRNSMSRYAFCKKGTVTPETFGNLVAPFSFGFSPELLPDRKTPKDGGISWWSSNEGAPPEGYVEFKPVQQAVLAFKEEENSSWALMADYFGWERKQLNNLLSGDRVQDKKFMKKELADFFLREIRKARSLPAARRKDIFEKRTRNPEKYFDRSVVVQMIDNFMQDYDIPHLGVMAAEIGIDHGTLRHLHSDVHPRVRVKTVEKLHDKIRAARVIREQRINHRNQTISRMYEHDEVERAS